MLELVLCIFEVMMLRKLFYIILAIFIPLLAVGALDYSGRFWHTEIFTSTYAVRGIDVSHYQGLINWNKVADDNVSFVYMKATEGTGHIDSYFSYNWEESKRVKIFHGAYHFFSMKSSGQNQGEYFISVVPKDKNSLPPAIDVEVSLSYSRVEVLREVMAMSSVLEEYYEKKPVIYMDMNIYKAFFEDSSIANKIWIREIYIHPDFFARTNWRFWQYSDRGDVQGITGPVDLNVYRGSYEDFLKEFDLNQL